MAEPVFKLLRCDAEASHMLGWAKKEVRRLVDFARLDAFNRTWKFGDVSVRAQYFGGVARLWLEAEATERMAVWATLNCPTPYRGLRQIEVFPLVPTTGFETQVEYVVGPSHDPPQTLDVGYRTTTTFTSWDGSTTVFSGSSEIFGTASPQAGSVVFTNYPVDDPDGIIRAWEEDGQPPAFMLQPSLTSGATITGAFSYVGNNPITGSIGRGVSMVVVPPPRSSVSGARVYTTTGDLLMSEGVTAYAGAGTKYGSLQGVSELMSLWSWLRFTISGIWHSFSHVLQYVIPNNCIHPIYQVWDTPENVVVPDAVVLNSDMPAEQYQAEQYTANRVSRQHRHAFLTTAMNDMEDAIRGGTFMLPAQWENTFKLNAPATKHVRRERPIAVGYADEILATGNSARIKRTVRAEYMGRTEAGADVSRVFEQEGYWWRTVTPCVHPYTGLVATTSVVDHYENWYEPPSEVLTEVYGDEERIFTVTSHTRPAFYIDSAAKTMGLFWSGSVTGGESDTYYSDSTYFEPSINARAPMINAYAPPGDPWPEGQTYALPTELLPPLPPYTNTLSGGLPEFFAQYFRENPARYEAGYVQSDEDKQWLSTRLMAGSTVSVVFLDPKTAIGEGGSFTPPQEVATGVTEINIRGVATWAYDAANGTFHRGAWRDITGVRVVMPEPITSLPGNVLLIYGGIKWDDVKETARAQRKALADPNDPAHDPLMKAVLDALTPQE